MLVDPSSLPQELAPYAEVLELRVARPTSVGWETPGWVAPVVPLTPGAPPHDGVYRGSWVSPAICVRLDLAQLPPQIADALRVAHPERVGADDGFYELCSASRSQRTNRDDALIALALKVADVVSATAPRR